MDEIESKLNNFHKHKADSVLEGFSDIAGNQFPGEFNVSGYHKEILALPNQPSSIWGIDRCLRIQDMSDKIHSYVFHMGIFAKGIDLQHNFVDPFKDKRLHKLQEEIISQFLSVLEVVGVDLREVEATYLDGVTVGGANEGRDKILKRKYSFPSDIESVKYLTGRVNLFPVRSLANVDINPVEGALVGPRLEVAYKGIEIGTIVFNCFKVDDGNLVPVNYVAGYAIGVERLIASLRDRNFLTSIPRYQDVFKTLKDSCIAANSSLFETEIFSIIYGAEVLALIPEQLSDHQKEKVRVLHKNLIKNLKDIGVPKEVFDSLVSHFRKT